jgi:hypothetical protein
MAYPARQIAFLCMVTALIVNPLAISAETNAQSAPACPAPKVDQRSWQVITLKSCGIRLRLPKTYAEKRWDVTIGNRLGASFRGAGRFETLDIDVESSPYSPFEHNKVVRQTDHQGYSECTETISGRGALIQAFRGGGIMLGPEGSSVPYYAGAIWQLADGRILRVSGTSGTRQSQDELLAVFRTVEFIR